MRKEDARKNERVDKCQDTESAKRVGSTAMK